MQENKISSLCLYPKNTMGQQKEGAASKRERREGLAEKGLFYFA